MSHLEHSEYQHQSDEKTIRVQITRAGKTYLDYGYEERSHQLLVKQIVAQKDNSPIDIGFVPRTMTEDGMPIQIWLFSSLSITPGVSALVRLIGLMRAPDSQYECPPVLLAVLPGDPVYSSAESPQDIINLLPEEAKQNLLQECKYEFLDRETAKLALRAGIERYVHAQRELQRGWSASPAWMATSLQKHWVGKAEVYTQYESELLRLPYRFQKYIAECLHPEERILLYVLRPSILTRRELLGLLGKKRLAEGILLITDQQVLFLEDIKPPSNSAGINWGYIAHTFPPERLLDARVLRKEGYVSLILELWSKTARDKLELIFPEDQSSWLVEAEDRLRKYLPCQENRKSLRRIYQDKSLRQSNYLELLDPSDLEDFKYLQKIMSSVLCEEGILYYAFAPRGTNTSAKILAYTPDEILIIEGPDKVSRVSISNISLVTIRHSLLGNELLFRTPGSQSREIALEINGPIIEDFLQMVTFLRRAMVNQTFA